VTIWDPAGVAVVLDLPAFAYTAAHEHPHGRLMHCVEGTIAERQQRASFETWR
jgi:hypothetical protein